MKIQFKKIISLFVVCSLVFCCCNTGSYASTPEDDDSIVLSEDDVLEIKEDYDLASAEGKIKYLNDVFNTIGADSNLIDMMNNDLINKLVNAESFGYSCAVNSSSSNSTTRSSGGDERYYDEMRLGIVWAKSGKEYTLLGGCKWLELPTMRISDIISIDLGDGSIVSGSQELSVRYEKNGTSYEEAYDSADENYQGIGTACTFEFILPNSADSINVLISYSITNSSDENTISLQYFHKFIPLPVNISVAYDVGISVSPESIFTEYNLQCGTAEEE